ncbi:MAG: MATE family efflux transporter [Clostridium chrysemydis]|uniref:MATE family efflux transporter n=1 Tax=Clostridium TaxID=1485 RepID=UPI001883A1E5|nr:MULTISPECIES: MATE family efflux transporter [Clostridium]MCR6514623.1 MATE family efflux transporter [Clostridium sp. LY3-2]
MGQTLNLTEGSIVKKLIALALPIMGTSFIQMAYNMIDMIWVGRVGSSAVAAVGTAGFFTWLAMAFVIVSKMGAEIKVSQSVGRKDYDSAKNYVRASLQINVALSIIYSLVMLLFRGPLIGFFKLGDPEVIHMAEVYLAAVVIGLPFYFINPVFTSIFNAIGNSKMPFYVNTCGLIVNIILDPILILGIGNFKGLGVLGAAIATVIAQVVVSLLFLYNIFKSNYDFLRVNILKDFSLKYAKIICKIGTPVAIQSGLFTVFAMILGRIIAVYGPVPIAVQKVGSQIESISWMTTEGLAVALGAFVGQNFGAKKFDRIIEGYKTVLKIALCIGVFASILLIFFGNYVFAIFIPESDAIVQGTSYLKILGYSQIFMCIEITTSGIFNGVSKTHIPSIISIVLTGLRVPLAYILSSPNILGIDGVWWAVSITSILKGFVIIFVLIKYYKSKKLFE